MAPNITNAPTGVLFEDDDQVKPQSGKLDVHVPQACDPNHKIRIVWRNVIIFVYLHAAALYGAWLLLTSAKLATIAFGESAGEPCPAAPPREREGDPRDVD